jgi:REP element-mobilizing transposase RayT
LPKADRDVEVYRRVERYLDLGWGVCHLREPAIASLVVRALHQFDGQRYVLHAWVVMPNHVHAQITPLAGVSLAGLLHSWKSYTAKAANRALELRGRFWSREYYDRYIRSETHFRDVTRYIEENPVKAGLCTSPSRWPFSSAAGRA